MRRKRIVTLFFILVFAFIPPSLFGGNSYIENLSRIKTSEGYTFKINYTTKEDWTDRLLFKLYCSFSKGVELSFSSGGMDNIKKGWHKTEIFIPKIYKDRYGYITEYRLEMYQNGILISLKSM